MAVPNENPPAGATPEERKPAADEVKAIIGGTAPPTTPLEPKSLKLLRQVMPYIPQKAPPIKMSDKEEPEAVASPAHPDIDGFNTAANAAFAALHEQRAPLGDYLMRLGMGMLSLEEAAAIRVMLGLSLELRLTESKEGRKTALFLDAATAHYYNPPEKKKRDRGAETAYEYAARIKDKYDTTLQLLVKDTRERRGAKSVVIPAWYQETQPDNTVYTPAQIEPLLIEPIRKRCREWEAGTAKFNFAEMETAGKALFFRMTRGLNDGRITQMSQGKITDNMLSKHSASPYEILTDTIMNGNVELAGSLVKAAGLASGEALAAEAARYMVGVPWKEKKNSADLMAFAQANKLAGNELLALARRQEQKDKFEFLEWLNTPQAEQQLGARTADGQFDAERFADFRFFLAKHTHDKKRPDQQALEAFYQDTKKTPRGKFLNGFLRTLRSRYGYYTLDGYGIATDLAQNIVRKAPQLGLAEVTDAFEQLSAESAEDATNPRVLPKNVAEGLALLAFPQNEALRNDLVQWITTPQVEAAEVVAKPKVKRAAKKPGAEALEGGGKRDPGRGGAGGPAGVG